MTNKNASGSAGKSGRSTKKSEIKLGSPEAVRRLTPVLRSLTKIVGSVGDAPPADPAEGEPLWATIPCGIL